MALLRILVGLVPPAACGWLLLRTLEWKQPVLTRLERIVLGAVLGITASMFVMFLLNTYAGVPLTLWGFLIAYAVLLVPLFTLRLTILRGPELQPHLAANSPTPRWAAIALAGLVAWTVLKIAASGITLIATPTYFDDSLDNWNFRAKVFHETQRIELTLPPDTSPGGISSYPPTVPLFKTWLVALAGGWDEGTANGAHAVWYVGCLILVYCAVRRRASAAWAVLAVYGLASLPLFLIQGLNAYADVYLAAHLLAAVSLLLAAAERTERDEALSFLRLSAIAIALVTFAKNEGLALYLPFLLASAGLCLWRLVRGGVLWMKDAAWAVAGIVLALAVVAGPWTLFKRTHGLVFGNAHALDELGFSWHKNVLISIAINTFFEGNWLLLFPLLIALLAVRWRQAFRSPLQVATVFVVLICLVQTLAFLFTSLATEALQQTGVARGIVQIVPVAILVGVLLIRGWVTREET